MSQPKLALQKVWKIFGPSPKSPPWQKEGVDFIARKKSVIALKNINLSINSGEFFVVIGLSGSGKSTLLRCLNALYQPTFGRIYFQGLDLAQLKPAQMQEILGKKIAMVFQHFALLPHRTILDNAAFGLEIKKVSKDKRIKIAKEYLDIMGLAPYFNLYPHQLSGGMKQRVGIARALAVEPEVLLMDEPFSALDPIIRKQLQDELINIQKELNKTIVFITHDLLEALRLSDRLAIMKGGEIVQSGSPKDILHKPADDYVSSFVQTLENKWLSELLPKEKVLSS
ncbi:MAG: betaine/proline/choline family ABC transporter ATP-binding protein [Myxococcales bacterium]|nr:betaine/proline/choline family ABC transporter ATP-binding protein [Myxococcales bacterium]USN49905.1 MAG: betaine/proline/choline family ABC transporter ATP-binding protein [Myxococcales bacterium]